MNIYKLVGGIFIFLIGMYFLLEKISQGAQKNYGAIILFAIITSIGIFQIIKARKPI
ncbi:MAG: hypothetical protein ACK4TA_17485 [Saprospiraceae bacterium]